MTTIVRSTLTTLEGFASREAARFVWQLDEQRRRLIADTRGLTVEDLGWQPRPGMNTIGMLLAHIAFAEVNLGQVGLAAEKAGHVADVIGLTEAEEGMPLAEGAPPAPALAGKSLDYFDDLLARARAHTHRVARALTDADLESEITRPPRPDGTVRQFNRAWVLYHMLDHEAGHHYQINLLRHLKKAMA